MSNTDNQTGPIKSTPQRDLAAFDLLPSIIRKQLRDALLDWSAEEVHYMLTAYSVNEMLSLLRHADRDKARQRIRESYGNDHPQLKGNL